MVQTRSETTGILAHTTVELAFDAAERDDTIWKISFDAEDGSRIKLVKRVFKQEMYFQPEYEKQKIVTCWNYEPLLPSIK